MSLSPVLAVHICAGILALPSGAAAISFRKGSPGHVLAGRIFVASMLIMATAGAWRAVVRDQPGNVVAGIVTGYLIGTAWLTARRKAGETRRYDWALLLIPLGAGVLDWICGFVALRRPTGSIAGIPAVMLFFFGSICLLAAAGDVRMLMSGGLGAARRIARHLWRMCFGLFIASSSFFLGGGSEDRPLKLLSAVGIGQHPTPSQFRTSLYLILSVLPLILLTFWLIRVRFTNASRMYPAARGGPGRVGA